MPIFIYNSLTRKKEEFVPLNHPKVNIYTCGVTVYDDSHIGHARSLYIFDIIRRYLKYRGFDVKFVRNITDVDDKIINRANELKVHWQELVKKYIGRYYQDLAALGIEKGDFEPQATENIPDMVRYIQTLIDKGYAYAAGGDVYFNVRKFSGYGLLSGQSIDQMETGVRIGPSELKHDSLDFALWKKSKTGEPSWDSPWSQGRPGWHIECSVMSQKFLKTDTLDIHAGGRDLIFPHHENEIAQAEALTGKQFAKYWIHHGLLTINGQKMSKSLGNFVTIKDALRKYHPDVLKLFYLQAHYSSPIDFSEKKMTEEKHRYISFVRLNDIYKEYRAKNLKKVLRLKDVDIVTVKEYEHKFESAMDDDFNTPQVLAVLEQLKSYAYHLHADDIVKNWPQFKYSVDTMNRLLRDIFGMHPDMADLMVDSRFRDIIDENLKDTKIIDEMVKERTRLKKEKSFTEADKIRKDLEVKGIILEDRKDGKTVWRWNF
ncbi:MAG: cysteine--tRNA ligase [Candidatus Omnitrophica bacterium]|nr:cysteine--tRNA ligase [Candidatus Omnitrophota bacterium]